MGMHLYVKGLRPVDAKWKKYKNIWDECLSIDIDPPQEIFDFF